VRESLAADGHQSTFSAATPSSLRTEHPCPVAHHHQRRVCAGETPVQERDGEREHVQQCKDNHRRISHQHTQRQPRRGACVFLAPTPVGGVVRCSLLHNVDVANARCHIDWGSAAWPRPCGAHGRQYRGYTGVQRTGGRLLIEHIYTVYVCCSTREQKS